MRLESVCILALFSSLPILRHAHIFFFTENKCITKNGNQMHKERQCVGVCRCVWGRVCMRRKGVCGSGVWQSARPLVIAQNSVKCSP